ncbi:centriolar coiled-coil protein of 110 kDa isoform X2 [Protopterus annectens]|uniref:centriolar coiled-coil protein of 110 kDa isoform X2 n=1 Tax=Protopterus annectens TaxID=7888 RepID=UPI001CFA08C2|nr:centriolar coiled-coil protein of 110 kDa isoform X2 [Protopterus annectens]
MVCTVDFTGLPLFNMQLSLERKKEMQQYKQKAVDVEVMRQNAKKNSLLNRVQAILESVQVRKVPDTNESGPLEAVSSHSLKPNQQNGFAILPNFSSIPHVATQSRHRSAEKTAVSSKSALGNSGKNSSEITTLKVDSSSSVSQTDYSVTAENSPSSITETRLQSSASADEKEKEKLDADTLELAKEDPVVPDHYAMSLQNLLKKSKEYIDKEKERSQHSPKNSTKRRLSESHSDKENDIAKTDASIKERTVYSNRSRSCSPVIFDKKVSPGRIIHANSMSGTLSSFSKVDIPVRPSTPSTFESDSDEELKRNFIFDNESSILRSLTGSYAKLPSPEPSLSPKMHRRHSRTLSAGHIVISNPVNAYELSPKGKDALVTQNGTEKITYKETLRFSTDEMKLCSSKLHESTGGTPETSALTLSSNGHVITKDVLHKEESSVFCETPDRCASVQSVRGLHSEERVPTCFRLHEPDVAIQPSVPHNVKSNNGAKTNSLPEWAKRGSPVELNKSYDVETPSPILLQSQSLRPCPYLAQTVSSSEKSLQNSLEGSIKHKLDKEVIETVDIKGSKETAASTLGVGLQQESMWMQKAICHSSPLCANSTEAPVSINSIDEGFIKKRMFAFEELRKRLEEQHAQQLSELIAEQEREQEKLRKEMEDQNRRLAEKKEELTEAATQNRSSEIMLNRKEKCVSGSVTPMTSPGNTGFSCSPNLHNSSSSAVTSNTSFCHWSPEDSVVPKLYTPKIYGRTRTRWSQVPVTDIHMKFEKVTALAKGFLTRRLMETEKVKALQQTVKDTIEFIKTFQSEPYSRRGPVSSQDMSLQDRVLAQLRAALYEIHDIFFVMKPADRMAILHHDREVHKEKMLRQMEKMKSPRDRVVLSAATQKSLDRKKQRRIGEAVLPNKKPPVKQNTPSETRILQPNQGQNAPVQKLLYRQGSVYGKDPKKKVKQCCSLGRQNSLG